MAAVKTIAAKTPGITDLKAPAQAKALATERLILLVTSEGWNAFTSFISLYLKNCFPGLTGCTKFPSNLSPGGGSCPAFRRITSEVQDLEPDLQ
jgi:hypothetical protein